MDDENLYEDFDGELDYEALFNSGDIVDNSASAPESVHQLL